ncbi:MAG: thiol:disulfide interchange protein DsbA/DsbL [Steroidobacteraceae bacterium]
MKLLVGLMLLGAAGAQAAAPVEGKDFTRLEIAQPTSDPKKIEVLEFFSYQCPHCYAFSKPFESWSRAQPPDVVVQRVPVGFGRPAWEAAARAYLVFAAMQVLPTVDDATFDAIHRQRLRLDSEQALTQWVGTQKVDAKQFASLYRSFGVEAQLKNAEARSRAFQIPSVPAIVVDGRYLVAVEDRGSFTPQLNVVSELVARARREKGGK